MAKSTIDIRLAKRLWSNLSATAVKSLRTLLEEHGFSVANGDVLYIDNRWYVTHAGLLRLARRRRCSGISVYPLPGFCDPVSSRWAFAATVYKNCARRGFTGHGDADPSNVSSLVRGAEMRVAETRAVNRALRKAYGIGICSIEEIGSSAGRPQARRGAESETRKISPQPVNGNSSNGHSNNGNGPRVRDRLCQIIRQHSLDAELVKSYAVDFCGTKTLREATREQVENFVVHLADWAEKDRNALLCQLNSYQRSQAGAA